MIFFLLGIFYSGLSDSVIELTTCEIQILENWTCISIMGKFLDALIQLECLLALYLI